MAIKKGKETLLELCTRAAILGNSISVRMLEYLSTAKNLPPGFKELAAEFLDLSRILWSIEAGLMEASQTRNKFPVAMVEELDGKFRKTNDDFVVLNQILLKYLDYETRGTFGRLQKGWRVMFSSADINKVRESLAKNRDALRMSSMVFRWSLGEAKADGSFGIGYTGLVAALERMNKTQSTVVIPPLSPAFQDKLDLPPLQLSPVPVVDKRPSLSLLPRSDSYNPPAASDEPRPDLYGASSILSSVHTDPSGVTHHESPLSRENYSEKSVHHERPLIREAYSNRSIHNDSPLHRETYSDRSSHTLLDDTLHNTLKAFAYPTQFLRLKADASTVTRWTPRPMPGAKSLASRSALMNAVQDQDHSKVERLLDSGVGSKDPNFLIQACVARNEEGTRLILAFGADPDAADSSGFIEGARLLIKYGADPNLQAGSDAESPLDLAIGENNFELVHLYLIGKTVLLKTITTTAPAKFLQLLLDYGTDPNCKDREGSTALFASIQAGRIDLMAHLLDHKANPNLPGPKHPLWPSTYRPEALQLLLSRGADSKKSPGVMELAASIKNIDSISILLNAGVSPNVKKDGIYTPLCSSIRDNSVEIVTLLLSKGADPNLPAAEYPAFKCITHDRLHILPQLVAAGANLHEPKGIVETAVAHNHMVALKYLIKNGVNLNDRTIREDRTEIVDLLLASGADPNIRGEDWPIAMAVKRPTVLKKLLTTTTNPSAVRGIIEMAVVANELESIKMLLDAGVSVEVKTGGVFSPLTTALREDRTDLVRFLLYEAHADPNAPGEHLPIIKAIRRCRGKDTECIEMLLERGADVNKMYRGWSAVLQAVESGNSKVLKLLIELGNGIDLNVRDAESGKTVKEIVNERGWDEACKLLFTDTPGQVSGAV
ncbi:ankyrin [Tothia fuscella]|uniref:Ankyrin n=1 Tax=Tothia fuscella TaxID=1048955 RepID=A0A9P4NPI2_9PEZI|nr:ankyrin [Tothia fuscella]